MVITGLLLRKLFRDVLAAKWQFSAVTILVMMSVAMFIGAYGGYLDLRTSFDNTYQVLGMADYWLRVDKIPQRAVTKLNAIPGIAAEGRIVQDILVFVHEGSPEKVVGHIVSLPGDRQPQINSLVVEEGDYLSSPYAREVLLHKKFASYHGFQPGDLITFKIGTLKAPFKVAGIVTSPEYLFTGPARSFGVIFMSKDSAEKLLNMRGYINEIVIRRDGAADASETFKRIGSALREFNIGRIEFKDSPLSLETRKRDITLGYKNAHVISLKDQSSDRMLRMDLDAFNRLSIIFPIMFMSMAALTIYILVGRLIQSQRPQIGVMKAIGYSRSQLLYHYLTYALFIGISGSILGAISGSFLADIFARQYAQSLNIPFVLVRTHWDVIAIGIFVAVAICTTGGLLPALTTANMQPAKSLRPPVPGGGAGHLLERIFPIPKLFPITVKLALRNILRNPYRSLFIIMGAASAVSLVLAAVVFMDSINLLMNLEFNHIEAYDAKVIFNGISSVSRAFESEHWRDVKMSEPMIELPYRFTYGSRFKDSTLIGLASQQELTHLLNSQGQLVKLEPEMLFLTPYLRKELQVKIGDMVQMEPLNGVVGAKEVVVGGFVEQPFGNAGYLPLEEVQKLAKVSGGATGFMMASDDGEIPPGLVKKMYDLPETSTVEFKAETKRFIEELMGFYYAFTGFMLVFGVALGAMIVFSGITVSVDERLLEMGTLRTLGTGIKQVAAIITIESFVLSSLGIVFGVFLGNWLADYFAGMYQAEDFNLPVTIFPQTYLFTVAGLLIVLLLSELPSLQRISRLKLASIIRQWTA